MKTALQAAVLPVAGFGLVCAALLAWVVLTWAPPASAAAPPAREAAARTEAACEARAASLDRATAAVERLRNRRNTLIIAHRLSTVRSADRIAVLERGRLVDVGRHEALLGRCPVYATLIREQLAGPGPPAPARRLLRTLAAPR